MWVHVSVKADDCCASSYQCTVLHGLKRPRNTLYAGACAIVLLHSECFLYVVYNKQVKTQTPPYTQHHAPPPSSSINNSSSCNASWNCRCTKSVLFPNHQSSQTFMPPVCSQTISHSSPSSVYRWCRRTGSNHCSINGQHAFQNQSST